MIALLSYLSEKCVMSGWSSQIFERTSGEFNRAICGEMPIRTPHLHFSEQIQPQQFQKTLKKFEKLYFWTNIKQFYHVRAARSSTPFFGQ